MWACWRGRISWARGEGLRIGSECVLLLDEEHRAEELLKNRGRVCLCGKRVSVCALPQPPPAPALLSH